jgi:hypothetical protein
MKILYFWHLLGKKSMKYISRTLLFDQRDHELLKLVNNIQSGEKTNDYFKRHFYPYYHPRGIQEMVESRGIRIAYSVIYLINSLEVGAMNERLNALRLLRDSVLNASESTLQLNTARVLIQIMKELVRAKGNYVRQFELAHSFRMATSGKPRVIRKLLRQYHLLEMPESWNQVSFDDHVHDANTKGRKTSSHLIMDAWIKGILRLRVIYNNYIEARFVTELVEAARIMGITVRIGIEYTGLFRDKVAQFIWVPRGFIDSQAFLCFLADPRTASMMKKGKQISEFQKACILELMNAFNNKHRKEINQTYGIQLEPISPSEFLEFVGIGQVFRFHLAILIEKKIYELLQNNLFDQNTDPKELLDQLSAENILKKYLSSEKNPDVTHPECMHLQANCPELLTAPPEEIIAQLIQLNSAYRITLNLKGLTPEDVLEILYDSEGTITRLEIFNYNHFDMENKSILEIVNLQTALNDGNVIALKRMIRNMIDGQTDKERIKKLYTILHDIGYVKTMYQFTPLKARIGSDSIGRSRKIKGMGFAIIKTLPRKAQREIRKKKNEQRTIIPVLMSVYKRTTLLPYRSQSTFLNCLFKIIPKKRKVIDWVVKEIPCLSPNGNIVTLGGMQTSGSLEYNRNVSLEDRLTPKHSWRFLNTNLKNSLKVLVGFIPAFLTFALTNDWWVLAYLGAFIWFGITGIRNIIQSVLGGGGFKRSPLLRWNDYVSWERLTDSLLYTGFSVPLLDYFVKTLLLQNTFDITTANHPYALYSIMALANGMYLSSHNAFRGLPKGAILGNFFRSILSIPLAIVYSMIAEASFGLIGMNNVGEILQKSAAIISKAASDTVAGLIEGTADRYHNIKMRRNDYQDRLGLLFDIYSRLEMMFPDKKPLELLHAPEDIRQSRNAEALDLGKIIVIISLDMLYFWMFQPRARSAVHQIVRSLSEEERTIFFQSQQILCQEKEISLLLVNGFLGEKFAKALSFYLGRYKEYLDTLSISTMKKT